MTRRGSTSPSPARLVLSRDLPAASIPAAPRPAERAPAVQVTSDAHGRLFLAGPGWRHELCRACTGRTVTLRNDHASPCDHCGATGFEPANPHSAGWGHP